MQKRERKDRRMKGKRREHLGLIVLFKS